MCGLVRLLGLAALLFSGMLAAQVESAQEIQLGQDPGAAAMEQERAAYQREAQQRFDDWRDRMDEFAATATAKSPTAGGSANERVTDAWESLNERWRAAQAANAAEWPAAKQQLDAAFDELEQAWQQQQATGDGKAPQAANDDERPYFYAIDTATRMLT